MLQNQSHVVSTAARSIYDYHDDISDDSYSHAAETDTENVEPEFARSHDGSAAHIQSCMYCLRESQSVCTNTTQVTSDAENIFPESLYNSDSLSSIPEEPAHKRTFTESDIHAWLACDSAEDMIPQAQPQYVILQEIRDWEMESTDYDNIESTEEVGPDPVTCNALTILTMYNSTQEFPELFPEDKPTELPTVRYTMQIMRHRIEVMSDSHWSP